MRRFRKITVDAIRYQWLFRYDDYEYANAPYLLLVMEAAPKSTLRVCFHIKEHFLLNSGLPVLYRGISTVINLNHPRIIAQMIRQCRENGETFRHVGCRCLDGITILEQAGYQTDWLV